MNPEFAKKQYMYIRKWNKKNHKKRIIFYKEQKGGKCSICGYDKNYSALEFHHLDPKQKIFGFGSTMLACGNRTKVEEELKKCILICGNCHAELHYPQWNKHL